MGGDVTAEIVAIGDELLLGLTLDRNSHYLAACLAESGIHLLRVQQVQDDIGEIVSSIRSALERARLVITVGGLGPTADDFTRRALAQVSGRELEFRPELYRKVEERFRKAGIKRIAAINRSQAMVPRGGWTIPNPAGTAAGLVVELEGNTLLALPGPPRELRAVLDSGGRELFRDLAGGRFVIHRTLRTTGVPESVIAQRLNRLQRKGELQLGPELKLAYLPSHATGVDLRLTSAGTDRRYLEQRIDAVFSVIKKHLGPAVYGEGDADLAAVLGELLLKSGRRLAVAESCTGGLVARRITTVPGSSRYFECGFVTYSNESKQKLLGVRRQLLLRHGAVSRQVAVAMARGVLRRTKADLSLAITGIAGPTGGTPEKPVGLVYMAVDDRGKITARKFNFPGDRNVVQERSAQAGLNLLRLVLLSG